MRKAVSLLTFVFALAAPQALSAAQSPHKRATRHRPTRRAAKSTPADANNAQATTQPSSSQATGQQSQQSQQPPQTSSPQATQTRQSTEQAIPQVRLDDPVVTPRAGGKSVDELASEAFAASLNDALRKPLAGETRVVGTLTRIECAADRLVFTVESEAYTLRLTSRDFGDVQIVAYTPQAGTQLSCGPRKLQSRAVVTYRPASGAKSDGTIVALEFVPENFKL